MQPVPGEPHPPPTPTEVAALAVHMHEGGVTAAKALGACFRGCSIR